MSATNSTPTISLPLFIGTDKPAWLTDWNGAMNTIDGAIATLQTAEGGTATALASLSQSVEALSGTVSQHTTSLQTITTAVAGNTGSINTINSLIGNGQPTTEDKTIIGAINEIYADIGGGTGVAADDVTYDNQTSGLTATDVQAAIDELAQGSGGTVEADDVSYDNTSSGLVATNVQAAIDEVDAKVDAIVPASYTLIATMTDTTAITGLALDGKNIIAVGVDNTNHRASLQYIPSQALPLLFVDSPSRVNVDLGDSGFGITSQGNDSYTFQSWTNQHVFKVYAG